MRVGRVAAIRLTLILALLLTACGGAQSATPQKTFGIGFTASLTSDFAFSGLEQRKALELAVKQINAAGGIDGAMVKIFVADDQAQPKQGPVIAQQFCDNPDIRVVLGYTYSSVALPAVPIYTECKLPVIGSAVTSPKLSGSSPYFFRNILGDAVMGAKMGEYAAKTLGFKRIAVLYQVDDYGIGVSNAFIDSATAGGAQITSRDGYQLGTRDFSTQVAKIKALSPDAIFIGGFWAEATKIAIQARDLGLTQKLLGTDGSLGPDLIKLGGQAVEGMIVYGMFDASVGLNNPLAQKFNQAFKAAYGEDPSNWAALENDAVNAVKAAAELEGGISRQNIRDGLAKLKDVPGVTGPTQFDSKGDRVLTKLYFFQVVNGRFTSVQ